MLHIAGRPAAALGSAAASFSSLLAAVVTRVLGKVKVDKQYEPLADLVGILVRSTNHDITTNHDYYSGKMLPSSPTS